MNVTIPATSDAAHTAMQESASTARLFGGGEASKVYCAMLTALAGCYLLELATAGIDRVPKIQAALQQTLAIRSVIEGRENATPRI